MWNCTPCLTLKPWKPYPVNPVSPIVSNINFLLTISIHCQEKWLRELIKWSPKRKCFDLLPNSLNLSLRKCMKISLENLYADIGALRVKRQMCTCAWKIFDGKTGEENRANKSDLSSFFSARSLSGACPFKLHKDFSFELSRSLNTHHD